MKAIDPVRLVEVDFVEIHRTTANSGNTFFEATHRKNRRAELKVAGIRLDISPEALDELIELLEDVRDDANSVRPGPGEPT